MKIVHTEGLRIATTEGHVILLEPNVPQEVQDFLGILALGKGATQVLAEGETPVEPTVVVKAPTVETPHDKLVKIMKELIATGDQANFRQDQQPKSSVLNRLFGSAVTEEQREKAWAEATRKA